MLPQEFEKLTGSSDFNEYEYANAIYMRIPMDKQVFCDEWKVFGGSKIIAQLYLKLLEKERENKILLDVLY